MRSVSSNPLLQLEGFDTAGKGVPPNNTQFIIREKVTWYSRLLHLGGLIYWGHQTCFSLKRRTESLGWIQVMHLTSISTWDLIVALSLINDRSVASIAYRSPVSLSIARDDVPYVSIRFFNLILSKGLPAGESMPELLNLIGYACYPSHLGHTGPENHILGQTLSPPNLLHTHFDWSVP